MTEKEFMATRIPFVIKDGIVVFEESREMRSAKWLKDIIGITEDEFRNTIYGGIFEDRITFVCGPTYAEADMNKVPLSAFMDILCKHNSVFGEREITVTNGSVIGVIGEAWPPISTVGTISCRV